MYFTGAPVQDQSAVLPFQLGANETEMLFVPVIDVAATLIVPLVLTVPAEMNLVAEIAMPEMPVQLPAS